MRIGPIIRPLSILLGAISAFMTVCFFYALISGESLVTVVSYVPSLCIGFGSLVVVGWIFRARGKAVLTNRESLLFVTLSWIAASLLGALPFSLAGSVPTYIDALYETMSGFTTTGASILKDVEALPKSLLLWRSTTHWLGGMGIVVLTVAIFPLLGFGGLRLMEAEAPGPSVDKITPRVAGTARIFWFLYIGMTVLQTILLMFGGMNLFDAMTHSFGTMATGGFSTKNLSFGHWNSAYLDAVTTTFMLLAGMNFTLHFKLLSGKAFSVFKDHELRVYLGIFVLSSLFISLDLMKSGIFPSFPQAIRHAVFQTSSILTTTGFATTDFALWPAASLGILLILMFIGGCAGSTAGGIKVVRIITLLKMAGTELRYIMNPRGVYSVFLNGTPIRKNIVYDTAALVFLYFMTALTSVLIVSSAGYDLVTSITATMANLGNIGPGLGPVGPIGNYSFFPGWIKLWLTFIMLAGRLEIYTVFVLFTRWFWKK